MQQLQLNSPRIRDIFETKFHSNQEEFMEFIISFIEENKKIVDNYFVKKEKTQFEYNKLSPMGWS